jgi:hypothetical protein
LLASSEEVKRGFGGDTKEISGSSETLNAFNKISERRSRSENGESQRKAEEDALPHSADNERVAAHLASALRDEKSIAFFRLVAQAVPREVIRDALMRTLDAQSVRRSRGALFAHLVRPYLPQRSLTNS